MTLPRISKLLAFAAGFPALMCAADPTMMSLIPPDATMVAELNLGRILASPIGQTISAAARQGMAEGARAELAKSKPELQDQIARLTSIDWSKDVQDVLIASRQNPPGALIIVRTALDFAQLQALAGQAGSESAVEGVPVLVSTRPDEGAFAYLDNSIVVIGQLPDVRAAIHRRNLRTPISAALAARVTEYSGYDLWLAMTGALPLPDQSQWTKSFGQVASINGGISLSPDFVLSVNLEARTQKAATEMADGLRSLTSMAAAQASNAGKTPTGLESLECRVSGRHVLVSLRVPESQIREGILQQRMAPAPQASQARPSNNAPPPGTIRVQTSEGTVLIPVDKDHP